MGERQETKTFCPHQASIGDVRDLDEAGACPNFLLRVLEAGAGSDILRRRLQLQLLRWHDIPVEDDAERVAVPDDRRALRVHHLWCEELGPVRLRPEEHRSPPDHGLAARSVEVDLQRRVAEGAHQAHELGHGAGGGSQGRLPADPPGPELLRQILFGAAEARNDLDEVSEGCDALSRDRDGGGTRMRFVADEVSEDLRE